MVWIRPQPENEPRPNCKGYLRAIVPAAAILVTIVAVVSYWH